MTLLEALARAWACALGAYASSAAAASTRSRRSARTCAVPLSTRDAVASETPAFLATSCNVTCARPGSAGPPIAALSVAPFARPLPILLLTTRCVVLTVHQKALSECAFLARPRRWPMVSQGTTSSTSTSAAQEPPGTAVVERGGPPLGERVR